MLLVEVMATTCFSVFHIFVVVTYQAVFCIFYFTYHGVTKVGLAEAKWWAFV